ncbi:Hypothetical predicted protein, partial [Paramuricea clavata]
ANVATDIGHKFLLQAIDDQIPAGDCDQIFIAVFPMIAKNAYKEAVTQNCSVISHI